MAEIYFATLDSQKKKLYANYCKLVKMKPSNKSSM